MNNIYEWLYNYYYAPYAEEVSASYADYAEVIRDARQLLLSGGDTTIHRADAIKALQDSWGVTTFAAGVHFGLRLTTDLGFFEVSPLSEAR